MSPLQRPASEDWGEISREGEAWTAEEYEEDADGQAPEVCKLPPGDGEEVNDCNGPAGGCEGFVEVCEQLDNVSTPCARAIVVTGTIHWRTCIVNETDSSNGARKLLSIFIARSCAPCSLAFLMMPCFRSKVVALSWCS